jgi:2'-5' RNA ligase
VTDGMVSHWWWRPGWAVGKSFYTWHVTFADGSQMAKLADAYRSALQGFPTLDVLRTDQLHMTIQGIGFTDHVRDDDLSAIIEATRAELAKLPRPTIEARTPHVDSETVQVAIQPVEAVRELRLALRRGIAAVWDDVPESVDGFRPHVTLAYSNAESGRRPEIEEAVHGVDSTPARFEVSALSLIRLHRDNGSYEWSEVATAAVGS